MAPFGFARPHDIVRTMNDWLHASPKALHGKSAFRLGIATNYGIDEDGVRVAMDRGVNVFLWTQHKNKSMRAPLKGALSGKRENTIIIGFASIGWFGWGVRSGAEKLLKELGGWCFSTRRPH